MEYYTNDKNLSELQISNNADYLIGVQQISNEIKKQINDEDDEGNEKPRK